MMRVVPGGSFVVVAGGAAATTDVSRTAAASARKQEVRRMNDLLEGTGSPGDGCGVASSICIGPRGQRSSARSEKMMSGAS